MDPATSREPAHIARAYLHAFGDKELDKIEALLAPDVEYTGPAMTLSSAAEVLTALRRIGAILVRNEIRRVFADGNDVCVIYDFVTDTTLGTVPTVEWLTIVEGRIRAVKVYYDRAPWLALRTGPATAKA
jgi:ketosteroid isomerase-like protein